MQTAVWTMATMLTLGACATSGGEREAEATPAAHTEGEAHGDQGHDDEAHGHDGGGMRHGFSDVERWVAVFDDPKRDAWQKPAEVVRLMGLKEGMTAVDIGAGTGYMLPHLRGAVGDSGRVLALDVEPALVAHMTSRIAKAGWKNVEARRVAPDDPGLAPKSVDRVLLVNTWHHVSDRTAYVRKLAQALKPDGAIVIVDFTKDSPMGPPPAHRLSPSDVISELGATGLRAKVVEETLPNQYVVVLQRR